MALPSRHTLVLAIHTTSPELQIALGCSQSYRQGSWHLGRDLGKYLHTHLQEIMVDTPWQDLMAIAVHTGVGSQTGMRIGLATALTLAQQLAIPIYLIDHGDSATALMELAEQQYEQGLRPSWRSAVTS